MHTYLSLIYREINNVHKIIWKSFDVGYNMCMVYPIRLIKFTFSGSKIIYALSNLGVIFPGKKTFKANIC